MLCLLQASSLTSSSLILAPSSQKQAPEHTFIVTCIIMQSACSSKIIVLTLLPMIDTFGDRCGLCGEACTPHSGHALLDSAGLGGLGRKVWPHSPAVATVSCGSAAPEEYPARAADSESHLQLVKCFLLHSR